MIVRRFTFLLVISILTTSFINMAEPISIAHAQEKEDELYFVAQKAFEDGFYDVSIRYIQQFVEKFPDSSRVVEAKILLGQCYFFKEQFLKAFEVFNSLADEGRYKDASLFWLGETYLKNKEYNKAKQQYSQIIDVYPESLYAPQALYSLAWIHFDQKDYESALERFQDIASQYPSHHLTEDSLLKVAECNYNLGRYQNAIDSFVQYAADYPQSNRLGDVNFYIAEAYYALEQFEPAIEYYRRMQEEIVDSRTKLSGMVSQGWAYLKLSEYESAKEVLDEAEVFAQEKGLSAEEVLLAQATMFTEQGENQKAVYAFSALITDYPESGRIAEAYLGRANIYYLMEDYLHAIKDYQFVSDQYDGLKKYAEIVEKSRFGLAWTYLKSGNIDQAISSFSGVLEKAQNEVVKVSALTQIGDAYQEVGDLEKALGVYDKALKDYPESPYADYVQYRQGIALLKLKRFDAAILSFGGLKANYPKSRYLVDSQYYLGVTYFQKGDWKGAKEVLQNFVDSITKDNEFISEAYYVLGLSYFNLDEYQQAQVIFRRLINQFSGDVNIVKNAEIGLAKVLYETKKETEAIEAFEDIAEKYVGTEAQIEALIWLGDHFNRKEDFNKARDYYLEIIKGFQNNKRISAVRFELGRVYENQQMFDAAVEQYQLASLGDDQDLVARAKLAIGEIFSRQFNPDEAIMIYESIIAKTPSFVRSAYVQMGKIYRSKGLVDKEIETYRKALESQEGDSDITNANLYFLMGDAFEVTNRPDLAVEEFLKIPYLNKRKLKWVVKAYLRVGRIFENIEKWDESIVIYNKIIDLNIDESKYAKERIQWIMENRD